MSTTCATVMSNNYLIQTSNMDAKVANKMLEINAGREYLTIKAANDARHSQAVGDLNYIYREGNKIQSSYDKQIRVEDLRSLGMNPIDGGGSWNTSDWANRHVPYNGIVTASRTGRGGCCGDGSGDKDTVWINQLACHCEKDRSCGCVCGDMPPGQSCDRILNTNMFQSFLDREKAWWKSQLDASTLAAWNKYDSAKATYINTPKMDIINVKCCQSFSTGDIIANSVTLQGNNLACNNS